MVEKSISVYLEHVRSFADAQTVPIRPLTLLVGENSSGKTTFLAVAASVFGNQPLTRPAFNEPPFNFGAFETIATYKGGKSGRADAFTIGFSMGDQVTPPYQDVKATYQRDRGGLGLTRFEAANDHGRITLRLEEETARGELVLTAKGDSPEAHEPINVQLENSDIISSYMSLTNLSSLLIAMTPNLRRGEARSLFDRTVKAAGSFRVPFSSVASLAPIRSRPQRTYDELSEDQSPEGDHVPRVLARLLNEERSSAKSNQVREALRRFGVDSGLFREIDVKRLGRGPDDPFQVRVNVGGPKVNLVDVGYGVSQALPVLVQSALRRENSLMLLQQPEVHLHPRAQAAFGSFLAELAALGRGALLVETHSDYLVDRVRLEVAAGKLKPSQVQILFFDRPKLDTIVYPIELDDQGNVENAPDCYREFFLKEQLRLLTRVGS